MITTAFLVMQFIISAKAGLVNAVEGTANVHVQELVPAGAPIRTGPSGRVEILLNPGTFLRLGEDSEALLDSVELTDVQVRIISGSAIIECGAVEKDTPIRVTYGTETLSISKPGTYRFPEDAASTSLGAWNQQRSELIAAANARSAETDAAMNNPAFPYQGQPLYPGLWPSGPLPGIGSAVSPFSFFSAYTGGYRFYQPFPTMAPLLLYPPIIVRPLPRPSPVLPLRPPVTRPPSPSRPSQPHLGGTRVARGGGRR
jgi:hypothetical protein